ncbi:MAG: TonB-dependent receptor [Mariniphaga sp.]
MQKFCELLCDAQQRWEKTIRIMKLTTGFILFAMFTASAVNTYSQNTRLNLNLKDATIVDIFREIERNSEFGFFFKSEEMNLEKRQSVSVSNATIDEVLKKVLDENYFYKILDKNIVVTKGSLEATVPGSRVSGKVTDSSGAPIPGASVVVKGTTIGITTDNDGKFSLTLPEDAKTLVFSFIGMRTQEISIVNKTLINLMMQEEAIGLEEVVAVGYGVQKKSNLTGSVAVTEMGKVLGNRPLTNVGTALQGAIPGLQVTTSSIPGASQSYNIRGTTSINGGDPLILVDNVEAQIELINPEDIETVTTLKDAASSAIYGARAAFGVILITTKKAKKNQKMVLNYSNNFAFETSINKVNQASVVDFLTAYKEAGYTTWYSNTQNIDKWLGYATAYKADPIKFGADAIANGDYFNPIWGNYIPKGDTKYYYVKENNAQNEIFDKQGFQQTHNLSASGGSEKITYRMAMGYTDQDGPLKTNKDQYQRLNVTSTVTADIAPWLNTSMDLRYTRSNTSNTDQNQDFTAGIYSTEYPNFAPLAGSWGTPLDPNGTQYVNTAPLSYILQGYPNKYRTENPRISSRTTITPFRGFEANLEYNFDENVFDYKKYTKKVIARGDQGTNTFYSTPTYRDEKSTVRYNSLNAYGTYTKSIADKHNFKIMAGYSQEQRYYEMMASSKKDMINADMPSFSSSADLTPVVTDQFTDYTIRSGFFRFNYNFKNKYLIELNGRYDGSSKFPTDTRFGFFPSVSAGWQLGRESFMDWSKNYLDELKIRGSWGEIGNQAIGNYQFLPQMTSYSSDWIVGAVRPTTLNAPSMVRSNFTWERVGTLDFGADFSLLRNKLQGTFDWYRRTTSGMLGPGAEFPSVVGATAPLQNIADLQTEGWELSLNWRDKIGKVGYSLGFNISDYRSHITKYNNAAGLFYDRNSAQSAKRYYEGMDFGEIWGYQFSRFYTIDDFVNTNTWALKPGVTSIKGVSPRPGDVMWKNISELTGTNEINNGADNLKDPGDRSVVGNETPRYQYGINTGISYKGFDLSAFFQGVGKRDVWLAGDLMFALSGSDGTGKFGTLYNHQMDYIHVKDYLNGDYTITNPGAKYPRIYGGNSLAASNRRISDAYLSNGAYLRVKNITLSYTVPKVMVNKMGLSGTKVFFSVENIYTFSSLPKGVDPERIGWGYPFFATYSFGFNITL